MGNKAVRKRTATVKHVEKAVEPTAVEPTAVEQAVEEKPFTEPELAPDAKPIQYTTPPHPEMKEPVYTMKCWAGEYKSNSWIGLGWAVLRHRFHHLIWDGSFKD